MSRISVTLDVLKLSGWLNADADCRVEGKACDAGGERCELGGGRAWGVVAAHKRHARGKARLKAWGPRARAERTTNMPRMFVTLEVSKLSGWLKACASCRVKGGHAMRGEVRSGRREGGRFAVAQAACTGKARIKAWGQGHPPQTCRPCS